MRIVLWVLLVFSNNLLYSQVTARTVSQSPFPSYYLKFTMVDQSVISLPSFKIHCEKSISSNNPVYLGLDLGYNYYSQDEEANANGFIVGLRLCHFKPQTFRSQSFFSYGFHYQKSYLNHYLLTSKDYPGFGTYNEYERTKFQKERFGFAINFGTQYPILGNIFFEYSGSLGVMHMKTITPAHITQETFVNGLYLDKVVTTPSIGISLKLGYVIL